MEETQSNCVKKKDDDKEMICASVGNVKAPVKKMKQARLPFMPLEQKTCREKEDCSLAKKRKLSDNESPAQKSKVQKSSTHLEKLSSDDYLDTSSGSETENNTPKELVQQSNTISKYLKENSRAIVLVKHLDKNKLRQAIERVREDSRESVCDSTNVIDLTNSDSQPAFERKEENVAVSEEKIISCDKNVTTESNVQDNTHSNNTSDVENMDVSLEDTSTLRESEENLSSPESNANEQTSSPEEVNRKSSLLEKTPVSDNVNCVDSPCSPSPEERRNITTPKSGRKSEKERALLESKRKEKDVLRQKQKEEKEHEKEEKKQQKEKEKEEKRKQKDEQKAEKDKQKKEEKEKKEKERQEKYQQKEEEQRKKQEILDVKNEEKRKKEEEKKMKEGEKLKEEEEKARKRERVKAAFSGFFIKQNSPPSKSERSVAGLFMPFELKKDMVLADRLPRQPLSDDGKDQLKEEMEKQECHCHYLTELKEGKHKPFRQSLSTLRNRFSDMDIIITGHDSETVKKVTYHVKFLKFRENTRPAYYGTWRKKSNVLTPRKPWKQDRALFDYEVDSDDEWEEEEPGESLSDSEGEEDVKEEDEEEEGDGWMVPHGYLSEDEGVEDDEPVTPELLKARQLAKVSAWESELKRRKTPVAINCIGLFWENSTGKESELMMEKLSKYQGICLVDLPIPTKLSRKHLDLTDELLDKPSPNTPKGPQKKPVPEEAMPDLIRLVHGSLSGIKKLIKEFRAYWKQKTTGILIQEQGNNSMEVDEEDKDESGKKSKMKEIKTEQSFTENDGNTDPDDCSISKRQLELKIMSTAVREKRQGYKKICWYVHKNVLKQYNSEDLVFPNVWEYVTKTAKVTAPKEKVKQEEITTPGRKTPTILQYVHPMSPSQIVSSLTPTNKDADQKQRNGGRKTPNILKFMSPQSSTPTLTVKNNDPQLKTRKKAVSLVFASTPSSTVNVEKDMKMDKTAVLQPTEKEASKADSTIDPADCVMSDSVTEASKPDSIIDTSVDCVISDSVTEASKPDTIVDPSGDCVMSDSVTEASKPDAIIDPSADCVVSDSMTVPKNQRCITDFAKSINHIKVKSNSVVQMDSSLAGNGLLASENRLKDKDPKSNVLNDIIILE